jgi:sterol desaturase/sphingolipid hydroxylase (fatty acid hydroxylase superfamily)
MDLVAALGSETALALSLVGVGCWELAWPEHRLDQNFGLRWTSNFALFAIALGLQIGLASSLPALVSVVFDQSPASRLSTVNSWAHLAYALLVLDAISYALHRISHSVPLLWRLHAAHHSDIAVDFTTTVRHHPGEAVFSAVAFGVSAAAAGCLPTPISTYPKGWTGRSPAFW